MPLGAPCPAAPKRSEKPNTMLYTHVAVALAALAAPVAEPQEGVIRVPLTTRYSKWR